VGLVLGGSSCFYFILTFYILLFLTFFFIFGGWGSRFGCASCGGDGADGVFFLDGLYRVI
jgi:hypothetical protein